MTDILGVPAAAEQSDDTKLIITLLLDGSGSMNSPGASGKRRIDEVNEAIARFCDVSSSRHDGNAAFIEEHFAIRAYGDVAVAVFSGADVRWLELAPGRGDHPFYPARNLVTPPKIKPSSTTPLATALIDALSVIETRKRVLTGQGYAYKCRPVLYVLSDGQPSDTHLLPEAIRRVREAEQQKKALVIVMGTGGADSDMLRSIASPNAYYSLSGVDLSGVIKFLSTSVNAAGAGDYDAPSDVIYEHMKKRAEATGWIDGD